MALIQIDDELRTAEVYIGFEPEAWHIEFRQDQPAQFEVIGPVPTQEFRGIEDLMNSGELPGLVKFAARGLVSLPDNKGGK
jgi:hypothetical protein